MQSPESKKEEFQKYLERAGVIDALTKVLVGLYEAPERPANAIDAMKEALGAPASADVDKLRATIDDQAKKLAAKDEHIQALQKMLDDLNKKTVK